MDVEEGIHARLVHLVQHMIHLGRPFESWGIVIVPILIHRWGPLTVEVLSTCVCSQMSVQREHVLLYSQE